MKYLNKVKATIKYEKYEPILIDLYNHFNGFSDIECDDSEESMYSYEEKRTLFDTYLNILKEIKDLDFFMQFQDKLYWNDITRALKSINSNFLYTEEFFDLFKDKIDWYIISKHPMGIFKDLKKNNIHIFKKYEKYLNWELMLEWHSDEVDFYFLEAFPDKPYDWNEISRCVKFSKKFGNKFKDKLNWSYITKFHTLSEKTLREFQDVIDWKYIRFYELCKFSKEFYIEFKDKLFKQY